MSEVKKIILAVDDDRGIAGSMQRIFNKYPEITVTNAEDAAGACKKLFSGEENKPDALVLDIMMPYGNLDERTRAILNPDTDPNKLETGLKILKYLRNKEKEAKIEPIWVAVITARNAVDVMDEIDCLLKIGDKKYGRIYSKPFNTFELEEDMAHVLGIKSHVIDVLLPDGYKPPNLESRNE